MSEEYDVFGELDELCNKNLLANFKSSVCPRSAGNDIDDDPAFQDEFEECFVSNRNMNKLNFGSQRKNARSKPIKSKKSNWAKLNKSQIETPSPALENLSSTAKQPEEPQIQQLPEEGRVTRSKNSALAKTVSQSLRAVPTARGRKAKKPASRQNLAVNALQSIPTRREYAALVAAQSTNVDYVDLVTSPLPRIEGVVNLDSDDEAKHVAEKALEERNSLDLSFDDENPEISVKVMWNGNPEVFKLRKHQKFANMFSKIAEREATDEKNLVFNINDKLLSANDTPASINYKIYEFINGRIFATEFRSHLGSDTRRRDANRISLKIQADQWKKPMQVDLLKTENFKILYIKCAEELNMPYGQLKLSFDGELLDINGTPADLELEGGEAIDLRIRK